MTRESEISSVKARSAIEPEVIAGKYKVRRLIGQGGVGSVFEVERISDGELFALKRLDRAMTRDDVAIGRFAREVRAASAARSEHIVSIVDVGTDSGAPFLVMERLEGEDLGARLQRTTRLGAGDAVEIALQILAGLKAAHASGVVHRDLKPDNIFLCKGRAGTPRVKILDFGMSKIRPPGTTIPLSLTRSGVAVGTPLYMSPEQAAARPDVDGRSDLYSVGAILFECLTGRPPHVGETSEAVLTLIRTVPAPRIREVAPRTAKPLAAVVDRALASERSVRFASASEMTRALAAAFVQRNLPGGGAARRTLWLAGVSAIAIGAMLVVAAAAWIRSRDAGGQGIGPPLRTQGASARP